MTEVLSGVNVRGRMVSSSEVRRLVGSGRSVDCRRLLERAYSLQGEVVHGQGIGSKQTVPTLNLSTRCRGDSRDRGVHHPDSRSGQRPNLGLDYERRLPADLRGQGLTIETFLLSPFDGDDAARIRVEFLRRVREERKFESPESLKSQIMKDAARVFSKAESFGVTRAV